MEINKIFLTPNGKYLNLVVTKANEKITLMSRYVSWLNMYQEAIPFIISSDFCFIRLVKSRPWSSRLKKEPKKYVQKQDLRPNTW